MKENIRHSVIINIPPDSGPYAKLLEQICSKILISDNASIFHIWCSEVIADHPIYLEVIAHKPITDPGLRYRIPHSYVLLIADPPMIEKIIGFI